MDATAIHVPEAAELHALDAAFLDVDGDQDLDVIMAVEGDANRLYFNNGEARLSWRKGAFGVIAHDSDGKQDVLIGGWGTQARLLLRQ